MTTRSTKASSRSTVLTAAQSALLTDLERKLIQETVPEELANLDVDDLGTLYDRVRKARDKYRGLHRRQASAQVGKDQGRGTGQQKNRGSADKYEIFETALARVSKREAEVARSNAAALKAERLEAARAAKGNPATKPAPAKAAAKAPAKAAAKPARTSKASASSSAVRASSARSSQARTQAKRDSR